jgi:hypothetical protein
MQEGASPSPPEFAEFVPLAPLTRAYIPESIDLSERMPSPKEQDGPSCMSWATAYATRGYYSQLENATKDDPAFLPSAPDMHNQIHGPDGCEKAGSSFSVALPFLQSKGTRSLKDIPIQFTCKSLPTVSTQPTFKINGYKKLAYTYNVDGRAVRGFEAPNVDRIKLQLKDGHPVPFTMKQGLRFKSLGAGETYNEGLLAKPDTKIGAHAMVLMGYDDRRHAFRLMNSWGDTWSDGGYGWIDYETFKNEVNEAWVLVPSKEPPRPAASRPMTSASKFNGSNGFACSDVTATTAISSDRGDRLEMRWTGFVGRQDRRDELIRRSLEEEFKVTVDVKLRPWPICEALLTLREPLRSPVRPKVELVGGERALKVGETYAIKVTAPAVPSFLYVVYIEDDGTVVNLSPRRGPVRAQTKERAELLFGDGKDGRSTFRVTALKSTGETGELLAKGDPHRGHEAVIVIASRSPIDELENEEKPGSAVYRVAANPKPPVTGTATDAPSPAALGPPDRLFLSKLREIVLRRAEGSALPQGVASALPRDVSADVLHLKIED